MMTSNYINHSNINVVEIGKKVVEYTKSDEHLLKRLNKATVDEKRYRELKKDAIKKKNSKDIRIYDRLILETMNLKNELEKEANKRGLKHSDISEDYLEHHGRLGMHWGKRNGPPYPLDFNKLSAEEKQKAKEETIRKGDIKTAYKNRDHYEDKELEAVKKRFNLNMEVAKIDRSMTKTTEDKIDALINKTDKVFKNIDKLGQSYNIGLKVLRTFGYDTSELPEYGKDKKNKNNNNKEN